MVNRQLSAGDGNASDSALQTGPVAPSFAEGGVSSPTAELATLPLPPLPMRKGDLTISKLIDLYLAHYSGRDSTRLQRLAWWSGKLGNLGLQEVTDDHVHEGLDELARQPSTYFAGHDAAGKPIYKVKRKTLAPATLNRYSAAIAAVFTWAIKRRIAPKGWIHPCRGVERREENNEKTRFLSDDERKRLLQACADSPWKRLYLLVLMALTTGARKSELTGLRWADIDFQHGIAHVGRSKNGDPKTLPLVPAVVAELLKFKGAPSAPVFPSRLNPDQPYAFEERFKEALRAAKIRAFRFHDLRHSCASMLAQNGATLLEIGDLLGHRQLQVTKRYSHLTTGHKKALVTRVLGDIQ